MNAVNFFPYRIPNMTHYRALLVASLLVVTGYSATPTASARTPESKEGTPVAGVCLLSREAVFAQSKVGQAASTRLKQLGDMQRSQLENERKPLQAQAESFQQKESSLSEAERKKQGSALQDRAQMFKAQVGSVSQRIQLTRAKVIERIGHDAQPVIASAYSAHHCGLLLNRDVVLAGNMTNDLTADVVKGLDRKTTTISFNLEPLPSNTQQPTSSGPTKRGNGGK